MIAITFALPEESRDFRRAIGAVRGEAGSWRASVSGESVVVAHCGVGPAAAARKTAALLAEHRPRMLIATGFAGALDPRLALGALVLAANVSDAKLLALAEKIAPAHLGALASTALPVETVAAKRALAAETGASAVDMETAAIAAACARAAVPLLAIRAISDRADEPLPVPFAQWFDLARQRPRALRLVAFLARHPGRIAPFTRFVRGLAPARAAMADFLVRFLEHQASILISSRSKHRPL